MFGRLILVLLLPFCLAKSPEVTFKNATFRGYIMFTEQFKKTIPVSNALKEFLPESEFDMIEFVDQNIPVLYENSLADLGDLDEVVLERCGIYEIRPGVLKNVSSLKRISLKGNKIEQIKEGVFTNLELCRIDLSLNLITTIHTNAFDNMPILLSINLSDNSLTRWNEDWFKNTPIVTTVSVQKNSISSLPNHAFKNFGHVKEFRGMKRKVRFDLSYNKIKTIYPEAFSGLTEIYYLWLDGNQLEEFSEDLLEGVDVDYFSLRSNNIRCLGGDLGKIIKADITFLEFNPFDCECLTRIKEWAKKKSKDVDLFFSDRNCSAQRIKSEKVALEDIQVAEGGTSSSPIIL